MSRTPIARLARATEQRGFTLVELLVVMAMLAVLAALMLASLATAQKGSRDTKRRSDLNQYRIALAQYAAANDSTYPGVTPVTGMSSTNSPYVQLSAGSYLSGFNDDPKTPGNYQYVTDANPGTNFGICVQLERNSSEMFVVGPTFAGTKPNATCTPQG